MKEKRAFPAHVPDDGVFKGMGGVYVALMTPFTKRDTINTEVIERQVAYYIKMGICGFYVTGGTGEGLLLSLAERKKVLECVVKANAGRVKVIAHIGCLNTDDSVKLAKHAEKSGADWVSSVAPVYFGQTDAAAHRHYTKIATATGLPFLIYSNGRGLDPDRDARFFDIPNVMGMKYTGSDFYALQRMIWRLDKPAIFFSGLDQLCVPAFSSGCLAGCIGTTQNIIPRHFVRMYQAMMRNDLATASQLQSEANRVVELMAENENWSYRKSMVRYIGLDVGFARPPYEPLSEETYMAFAERIRKQGIIKADAAKE